MLTTLFPITLPDRSARGIVGGRELAEFAPIPLRLIVGYGFMAHGYAKLSRGPETFAAVLQTIGLPVPHLLAWLATLVELIGGFCVAIGAFVSLASVPMAVLLLTALVTIHLPYGFFSVKLVEVTANGTKFGPVGYEVTLLYLAALAALAMGGAGPLSFDEWRLGRKQTLSRRGGSERAVKPGRWSIARSGTTAESMERGRCADRDGPMQRYVEPTQQLVTEIVVTNIERSVSFYRRLGFALLRDGGDFFELTWEEHHLYLAEVSAFRDVAGVATPAAPLRFPVANVRVMVPDVDKYWKLAKEIGAPIVTPVGDRYYGLRDFTIADPDGFGIRFASALMLDQADQPPCRGDRVGASS